MGHYKHDDLLLKTIAAGFAEEPGIGQPIPSAWLPFLSMEELIQVHKYTLGYIKARITNTLTSKLKV